WWPLGLLLGTFGSVKFDPLYWWAGRLWGRGLIDVIAGRSARAARNAARAERLAHRYGPLAILLTYVIPLPSAVVYATVAAAGMRFRTFFLFDLLGAVGTRGLYIYLGYRLGQPAVEVVEVIAQYSWYLSIALLAFVFFSMWRQSRRTRS
ncbi:MAG: DedA family protein, partial [Actinomycetes bacterium]